MKILIVEDEEEWRNGLESLFKASFGDSSEVRTASNATDAARLLDRGGWDLLVLDILLGGTDGRSLVRRAAERWACRAVIVITGMQAGDPIETELPDGSRSVVMLRDYVERYFPGRKSQCLTKNRKGTLAQNLEFHAPSLAPEEIARMCSDPDATPFMDAIDHYSLIRRVSDSVTAEVWEAEDVHSRARVAIKLMKPSRNATAAWKRLDREIEVMRRVEHPNIVPLLGSGRHEGQPYLVMRWIEGPTLADRITEGAMDWEAAREIALGIVSAVRALHERGVVHRDIKPSNVLMDGNVPLLTDFGLVRRVDGEHPGEGSPEAIFAGTPQYSAPEQAGSGRVDARSDIYSLGVVLYELTTGRRPFDSDCMDKLFRMHREESPRDPGDVNPKIPAPASAMIARCLAKNPEARFQSVRELEESLRELPPPGV